MTQYTLYQGNLYFSKCHTVSLYKRQCNFTLAVKVSTSSPALIFVKLAIAQQHYVKISYTGIHPKLDEIFRKYGRKFIYYFKRSVWLSHRVYSTQYITVDVFRTECYPNRTENVANGGKISLKPLSKECLSPSRFSLNSRLLDNFM